MQSGYFISNFFKNSFSIPWCLRDQLMEGIWKWIKEDLKDVISYLLNPRKFLEFSYRKPRSGRGKTQILPVPDFRNII